MADYRVLIAVAAIIIVASIILGWREAGGGQRKKKTEPGKNPDAIEVAQEYHCLFINEDTKYREYVALIHPDKPDEVGNEQGIFVFKGGAESDGIINASKIDRKFTFNEFGTGIVEAHYYPNGLNDANSKLLAEKDRKIVELAKDNERLKSEAKGKHLTTIEAAHLAHEEQGAKRADATPQGYGQDSYKPPQENGDQKKSSEWR